MLEIERVSKAFGGVHAVEQLSLVITAGQITGLVGPNGSGKTTLINMLSGTLALDGGSVVVQSGERLRQLKRYRLPSYGITRTFQEVRLFEQMTVLDNVLVALTPRRVVRSLSKRGERERRSRAEELLAQVGLLEKRTQLAQSLSYGQRKLLEIARALATDSDVYLFDEPFAGLFPEMAETIAGLVDELRAAGKAVVLIEHDMGLIRQLADHVVVMDGGRLLAEGKPSEVLARRDVIEAYLGA